MATERGGRILLAGVLAAVWACGDPGAGPDAGAVEAPSPPPPADDGGETDEERELRETMEALAAIGYTEYGGELAQETGIVLHDRARSSPGYTLYNSVPHCLTELLDPEGNVLRSWSFDSWWTVRSRLLPDGDLLTIHHESDGSSSLTRTSWDGEERWRLPDAHHDVRPTPAGTLVTLVTHRRDLPEEMQGGQAPYLVDDLLTELTPEGEVIRQHSLHDMIVALGPRLPIRFLGDLEPTRAADVYHSNSIEALAFPALAEESALYRASNVIVSVRNQHTVAIVGMERGRILWHWGRDEVLRQHDATVLASGNVLLFDNGSPARPWSRIVEVDPRTDEITWQWRGTPQEDFYSDARGTVQALPNGNVLVGNSNNGEAFELTRDGDVVWRFRNPHTDQRGLPGAIRIERLEPAMVEGILERFGGR